MELDTDSVVMSVGFRPGKSLLDKLPDTGANLRNRHQRSVATILQPIWDGFEVGNNTYKNNS